MNLRHTKRPLLRNEILEAQKNAKSAQEVANFLGVDKSTYRKYAELYGIYDNVKNKGGKGVKKPRINDNNVSMDDLFANKHPYYNRLKLKRRVIAGGFLPEECDLCGFKEHRITDQQVPLMLTFRDGDVKNMALTNLRLLCYNCAFLTMGSLERINIEAPASTPIIEESPLSPEDIAAAIESAKSELNSL